MRLLTGRVTRRVLVLVHRSELLEQAGRAFAVVEPRARTGFLAGAVQRDVDSCHVLIASVASLSRQRHLRAFGRTAFDMIHIDEAHHATGRSTYAAVLEYFDGGGVEGPLLVGWTATPNRGDGASLRGLFDAIPFAKHAADGMREGWLVPAHYLPVHIAGDLLAAGKGREFPRDQLAKLMDQPRVNATMIGRYLAVRARWLGEKREAPCTLALAVTRRHAMNLVGLLCEQGVSAVYVGGDLGPADRATRIEAFREGRTEVLVGVQLLLEGFDVPGINITVDCRPTRSVVVATQAFGRGLRTAPGKTEALYLQAVPEHAAEAGMIRVPNLFGIPEPWTPTLDELFATTRIDEVGRRSEQRERARAVLELGRGAGEQWDATERLAWIQAVIREDPGEAEAVTRALPPEMATSECLWAMTLDGHVELPLGGERRARIAAADLLGRHEVSWWDGEQWELIGVAGTWGEAGAIAERWLTRQFPDQGRLYRKGLAEQWMREPATPAQVARLKALVPGITPERLAGLRRGVASRLIGCLGYRTDGGARAMAEAH
jgi:hypothetical protein